MATLANDIAAFERMKSTLESQHGGQWVVFESGQLIGAFNDFEDAASTAVDQFGRGP